jgi:hydroxypyruvate reductase 1
LATGATVPSGSSPNRGENRSSNRCLKAAGGIAYSNYAVGFNNVDLDAATRAGIPVGNTPGVFTETTAEMAVALTFAAARRLGEAERFLRAGRYTGWLPDLFLGSLLQGKTLGIIGAGRIGAAYARMMVQGHGMHVIYMTLPTITNWNRLSPSTVAFGSSQHHTPVTCRRAESLEALLELRIASASTRFWTTPPTTSSMPAGWRS